MLYFEYCVTRQDLSAENVASIVLQGLSNIYMMINNLW